MSGIYSVFLAGFGEINFVFIYCLELKLLYLMYLFLNWCWRKILILFLGRC